MTPAVEFDAEGLVARAARASLDALRRAGAYIRAVARRKVQASPKASPAGQPPHTRRGALKRGLLFGVDTGGERVLVGPGFRFVGTSMSAHEFMRRKNRRDLSRWFWREGSERSGERRSEAKPPARARAAA